MTVKGVLLSVLDVIMLRDCEGDVNAGVVDGEMCGCGECGA